MAFLALCFEWTRLLEYFFEESRHLLRGSCFLVGAVALDANGGRLVRHQACENRYERESERGSGKPETVAPEEFPGLVETLRIARLHRIAIEMPLHILGQRISRGITRLRRLGQRHVRNAFEFAFQLAREFRRGQFATLRHFFRGGGFARQPLPERRYCIALDRPANFEKAAVLAKPERNPAR